MNYCMFAPVDFNQDTYLAASCFMSLDDMLYDPKHEFHHSINGSCSFMRTAEWSRFQVLFKEYIPCNIIF